MLASAELAITREAHARDLFELVLLLAVCLEPERSDELLDGFADEIGRLQRLRKRRLWQALRLEQQLRAEREAPIGSKGWLADQMRKAA
jgi:hypothetical protein